MELANKIVDPQTGHLLLHFDGAWRPLNHHKSYGHDIEASWLLWEAAELLDDPMLLAEIRPAVLRLAECTQAYGVAADGGIWDEMSEAGELHAEKHWWAQAEGLVGFVNAYQLTGNASYLDTTYLVWQFILDQIVDAEHGGWFWGRDGENGLLTGPKAGSWKTPYHNGRACFELLQRLPRLAAVAA